MLECKSCGAGFPAVETHCLYCGERLRPPTAAEQRHEEKQRESAQARSSWDEAWTDFQRRKEKDKSAVGSGKNDKDAQGTAWKPNSSRAKGYSATRRDPFWQEAPGAGRTSGAQEPLHMFGQGDRSKLVAFVLALLTGTFGVHWFYLGMPGRGMLHILFCWSGIPTILSIIDAVRFVGVSDAQFAQIYG